MNTNAPRLIQISVLALALLGLVSTTYANGTITECSEAQLRFALIGGGVVRLACDGVISLSSTIVVAKEVVLDGTGHDTTLSGEGTIRIFLVQPGASLTLRNVTLSGGGLFGQASESVYGAAIYNNAGTVILEGCVLSDHEVGGGAGSNAIGFGVNGNNGGHAAGGAIYNSGGRLVVNNSTFASNRVTGGPGGNAGAGIEDYNNGYGGDGAKGGDGSGAAICNVANGEVSVFGSLFFGNQAAGGAGGLGASGTVPGRAGKNGSSGSALGAAIFNESGRIEVVNSALLANSGIGPNGRAGGIGVVGPAGTLGVTGMNGGSAGGAFGGAAFNNDGILSFTNCSFAENGVLGGNGGDGGPVASTDFLAIGGNGGAGGNAFGAGLFSSKGRTMVVNCTFSDNRVMGGQGGLGGIGPGPAKDGDTGGRGLGSGGAIFNRDGTVELRNSILAHSTGQNAVGNVSDQGFNLSSDDTPSLTATGSRNRVDPRLDSLQTCGLVPCITLSADSPAVNAIQSDANQAPAFDQQNGLRVEPYDIGASEFDAIFPPPTLQVQRDGDAVLFYWNATCCSVLQMSKDMHKWIAVPDQPRTMNGVCALRIVPNLDAACFRLVRR